MDVTIGGENANSYVTVSAATDFISLYGKEDEVVTWNSLTNQESLLIQATAWIDNSINFKGEITNSDQALQWPRVYAPKNNISDYPSDVIPEKLQIATSLLAIELNNESRDVSVNFNELKSIGAGDVSLDFRDSTEQLDNKDVISNRVYLHLKTLGYKNTSSFNSNTTISRLVR
jgi:hypothetical protein